MKIAVAGIGYVGLANAVVLAQNHDVVIVDIDNSKVLQVNRGEAPISDPDIEQYLAHGGLSLKATLDPASAYLDAAFVVIATPTDYDEVTNEFNTSSVEKVIRDVLAVNSTATLIVKSTVPVGFTDRMVQQHPNATIIFSPEFLREGRALHDNLHPARIVVGGRSEAAKEFGKLLRDGAIADDVPIVLTGSSEAEAIKLFANTYLALRVAYFNELDTFAAVHGLDTAEIIEAVGLDPRIGSHYNNPSFGYGGYCLPKDTKQLRANYRNVPQNLINAVVAANRTRKDFIADEILRMSPTTVGVFRLIMKTSSDNFRASSVLGIMDRLADQGVDVIIYEPTITQSTYNGMEVVGDLATFKARSDVILANRRSSALLDVVDRVYSRDLSGID